MYCPSRSRTFILILLEEWQTGSSVADVEGLPRAVAAGCSARGRDSRWSLPVGLPDVSPCAMQVLKRRIRHNCYSHGSARDKLVAKVCSCV